MDLTQITIKSICASCSNWAIGEKKVNRCMKVLRRYSRNWDFRSNGLQTRMECRGLRRALAQKETESPSMRNYERLRGSQHDPDKAHSTLYMRRKMKALNRLDCDQGRELLCHASISVNDRFWKFGRRREPLRERQKRRLSTLRLLKHRHCRLKGVG